MLSADWLSGYLSTYDFDLFYVISGCYFDVFIDCIKLAVLRYCYSFMVSYSIPSPVLLMCCVASVVARSIVLYRTCTGQPAVWGFILLGLTHCDRVFLFFQRFTCNTVVGPWWVWSLFRSVVKPCSISIYGPSLVRRLMAAQCCTVHTLRLHTMLA